MKGSCAVCVLALNTLDPVVKHCANPKKETHHKPLNHFSPVECLGLKAAPPT